MLLFKLLPICNEIVQKPVVNFINILLAVVLIKIDISNFSLLAVSV